MSNPKAIVEYVVRCKLPSSAAYPSGDTEYDEAYRRAIFANKPEGFEVHWQTKHLWPTDQDGMTWVRLYCTDNKKAVEYYRNRLVAVEEELERVKNLARQIVGESIR